VITGRYTTSRGRGGLAIRRKSRDSLPASFYLICFYLQIAYFREWACLDSNQGPLPYQRSVTLFRRFLEIAKPLQTRKFSARDFSRVFKLFAWVAARLLHTSTCC
jgi:hypothetical protein